MACADFADACARRLLRALYSTHARLCAQEVAHKNGTKLYFTTPEVPLAGAPLTLYANRRRMAHGLGDSPNVRLHVGFNEWSSGSQELELKPSNLWRGHDIDW